jgi:hypothetical protein
MSASLEKGFLTNNEVLVRLTARTYELQKGGYVIHNLKHTSACIILTLRGVNLLRAHCWSYLEADISFSHLHYPFTCVNLFPSQFPTRIFNDFFPIHASWPLHLTLHLITVISGKEYRSGCSPLCVFFSNIYSNILLSTLTVLPLMQETNFNTHTKLDERQKKILN